MAFEEEEDAFDEDMASLRAWLTAGTPRSVLMVVGVPGCGVSTALARMLEALQVESVWLDMGTPRLRAAMANAGCSCVSATGRRKVVVLEGFDAIMRDANGAADVADALRRQLPAPLVVLSHPTRTIVRRFRDLFTAATRERATVITVRPMGPARIAAILRAVHPAMAAPLADEMARACQGDVRSALASLALDETTDAYAKDDVPDADAVVEDALAGQIATVAEALLRGSIEPSVVSHGIHERYGFSVAVADAFSLADMIEERMFATQRWELSGVYAAMAVAFPAVHLDPSQVLPRGNERAFVYGMTWSREHLRAARTKMFLTVRTQRASANLPVTLDLTDLALMRRMVMDTFGRGTRGNRGTRGGAAIENQDAFRRIVDGLGPDGVLAIMRLWKGSYTQTMHAKVSRIITSKIKTT